MGKTLFVMKNTDLIIGDVATGPNFKCEVSKVEIVGDTPVVKATAACPTGQYSDVGNTSWEVRVTYVNMIEEAAGGTMTFFDFLRENVGTKMLLTWRPRSGGKGYSATVTIPAGSFSGEVEKSTDATVTFPVDGDISDVAAA